MLNALPSVMSVINGKGGVGKSSLTANVGALAAAAGYKTLLVDLDPQGNLGLDLGYYDRSDRGAGLIDAMTRGHVLPVMENIRPGLNVVAGGPDLKMWAGYAFSQGPGDQRFLTLRNALAATAAEHDLVIIDCPPGDEELQMQALVASRHAVIPASPDVAGRLGMVRVAELFQKVMSLNPDLELLGVVLFRMPASASAVRRDTINAIAEALGDPGIVFDAVIRDSFKTATDARAAGLTVFEYEEAAAAQEPFWKAMRDGRKTRRLASETAARGLAQDYQDLARELLVRRNASVEALIEGAAV